MRRFPFSKARVVVALAVFVSVVVGLFVTGGWGTLSSMGYDAVAYLCPLGALETLVAEHAMVPRAVVALVIALVIAALFGRVFCSWVCPVPPIQRFFGRGGSGEGADNVPAEADTSDAQPSQPPCSRCALPPVGGKRDGLQVDSRHGVLLGALVSSAAFGFPVFCLVCPVGLSIALVIAVYQAVFQQSPTVSLLVFAAILLVEVVFFRKWCHRLCPMGALMSLVGAKAPLAKPRVDASACLRSKGADCTACVAACPELLDPHSESIPECTRCGVCAEKCPASAISLRLRSVEKELGPPTDPAA